MDVWDWQDFPTLREWDYPNSYKEITGKFGKPPNILPRKGNMERTRIALRVEIDLDPIPGWGDNPQDIANMVNRYLADTVPHYNPTVALIDTNEKGD